MIDSLLRLSIIVIDKGSDIPGLPDATPDNALATVLSIVFALAGAISILIITIAGLTMVVSQGNPEAVNRSKNAVLYAAIGLAICVMGYTIVAFVVNRL